MHQNRKLLNYSLVKLRYSSTTSKIRDFPDNHIYASDQPLVFHIVFFSSTYSLNISDPKVPMLSAFYVILSPCVIVSPGIDH